MGEQSPAFGYYWYSTRLFNLYHRHNPYSVLIVWCQDTYLFISSQYTVDLRPICAYFYREEGELFTRGKSIGFPFTEFPLLSRAFRDQLFVFVRVSDLKSRVARICIVSDRDHLCYWIRERYSRLAFWRIVVGQLCSKISQPLADQFAFPENSSINLSRFLSTSETERESYQLVLSWIPFKEEGKGFFLPF